MDAMEARQGDGATWFRLGHAIIDGAGPLPLSSVLGPADWTHGAETRWRPAAGLGVGGGMLLEVHGETDRVSMSVILVPFPKVSTEPAAKPVPASD